MPEREPGGRANQRRRTRKDLLRAAARLMRKGRRPSLDEVAEEALVSRATAYRYFPGVEALLVEASLDVGVPEPDELFADGSPESLAERLEKVDLTLHRVVVENEAALRVMLAHSLERRAANDVGEAIPVRQNRRSPLIEAALAPARGRLAPASYEKLAAALALVVGTEAMIVFRDVLQLPDEEALSVKRWAIRALVAAAEGKDQHRCS